jgi:hypothetical protein
MDKTKIIRKVLLEHAIAGNVSQEVMNYVGGPLPSEYGGISITNIRKTITIPDPADFITTENNVEFCETLLKQPDNKFKDAAECIRVLHIAIAQQMQVGGVTSFDWNGQKFKACLQRNISKKMSYFSGYYGTLQGGNCYSPEWYNMLEVGKKKPKGNGVAGVSGMNLTIAGPDYK